MHEGPVVRVAEVFLDLLHLVEEFVSVERRLALIGGAWSAVALATRTRAATLATRRIAAAIATRRIAASAAALTVSSTMAVSTTVTVAATMA